MFHDTAAAGCLLVKYCLSFGSGTLSWLLRRLYGGTVTPCWWPSTVSPRLGGRRGLAGRRACLPPGLHCAANPLVCYMGNNHMGTEPGYRCLACEAEPVAACRCLAVIQQQAASRVDGLACHTCVTHGYGIVRHARCRSHG